MQSTRRPPFVPRRPFRGARAALFGALATLAGACGDSGIARRYFPDHDAIRWERDSALLAARPEVLFRVLANDGALEVVPIGTVGGSGFEVLRLSDRGWRLMDASYLRSGRALHAYRRGRAADSLAMLRGMWEPGAEPLPGPRCAVVIPMGRATAASGSDGGAPLFATSGTRPGPRHTGTLDQDAVARGLDHIAKLVAPGTSISEQQLRQYTRRVHQIPTGINGGTTLLVEYNDPAPIPDTMAPVGVRPRQLIVALDQGAFAVRPSYKFTTTGSRVSPPRLEFLDYLDLDDDGVPELFFGLLDRERAPLYTIVLRYQGDAWREIHRFSGTRCDF